MKRIIAALALVLTLALPGLAAAEGTGMYLAPKFLMSIQDTGRWNVRPLWPVRAWTTTASLPWAARWLGYDFWPQQMLPLRAEIEFALRGNSEKSWDGVWDGTNFSTKGLWNTSTLFLNLYYDIQTGTPFVPISARARVWPSIMWNTRCMVAAMVSAPATISPTSPGTWARAWPTTLTKNFAVDLGYRFMMMGYNEVSIGGSNISNQPYNNEFMLGPALYLLKPVPRMHPKKPAPRRVFVSGAWPAVFVGTH